MPTIDLYPLGARVFALRGCGLWSVGEAGLVVEQYELGARPGRTILFKNGGYDGFSAQDLELFVAPEGSIDSQAARYVFHSVGKLSADLERGLFDFKAFPSFGEWLSAKEKIDLTSDCSLASNTSKPGRM
jgi:hypothetical protein